MYILHGIIEMGDFQMTCRNEKKSELLLGKNYNSCSETFDDV